VPWRGPSYKGEFPSLGWLAIDWIEDYLPVPDGDKQGEPLVLSDPQKRLIVKHYRIRERKPVPTALNWRYYRRSLKVGPKGWGKDPLLAALSWFEACGPARFDGWDADGEPVGRPWQTPWVQMVGTAEDQTDNTYVPFRQMGEYGWLDEFRPDIGMTRTLFPGGGIVEPVTSAAATREGQRVTFAVLGETWQWHESNGGLLLAKAVRRNTAKMGGATFEISNMWQRGLGSVAERTMEASRSDPTISVEWVRPTPPEGWPADLKWPPLDDDKACKAAIAQVYEGHGWVDPSRVLLEMRDDDTSEDEARRFYLNDEDDASSDFVSADDWRAMATGDSLNDGDFVVLGFDGSVVDDATALVAVRISDGFLEPIGIWQPEHGDAVDRAAVDAAVDDAFSRFEVWRMYGDPPHWQSYFDRWSDRHGSDRVVEWWTNRRAAMSYALERFKTEVTGHSFGHSGDETLDRHVLNARQRVAGSGHLAIAKEHPKSKRKIDGCMAAVLAVEARGDAVAAGAGVQKRRRVAGYS
jgi:hypothetical protein